MPLHPEEVLATKDRLARSSPWVTLFFLSHDSLEVWERFQPSGYTATTTYWAHIPEYNRYVQCLLTGANPSVLNQHRRGLQPCRCRLSTSHSPTFPTSGLHFPPKGPVRSQVIYPTIINWSWEKTNPKSREWKPPLDFYRKLSSKYSMC
jgi:hypothetical protein